MNHRQIVRFVAAGGAAAAANFGSRILLSEVLQYVPAIVLAYVIGMVTAFVLNRLFVFPEARNRLRSQVAWFVIINIAAVLQTLGISLALARWLFPAMGMSFYPEAVAHAIGVAVPVLTSYVGHKRFSFNPAPRN